jgi:glycerol-3-phosphate acyltransferase PlsX
LLRIALDVLGGDHGPPVTVEGAYSFIENNPSDTLVLVGDKGYIEDQLSKYPSQIYEHIDIVHAPDNIEMNDSPTEAIRKKKNSSMVVGLELHKAGEVAAFVSAGSTGAQMAGSLMSLKRIPGVKRPGIGAFLPSEKGLVFLIDVGANVDCRPINILQFALMGDIFVSDVFNASNPKVGLLNIGEEENKGNDLTSHSFELLSSQLPNFYGNVEGNDILRGKTDIIVCDGFVGNTLLKMAESVMGVLSKSIKRSIGNNLLTNIGALLVRPAFSELKRVYSYEESGGVPLLGINGISIICHGKSSAKAIKNALQVAKDMKSKKVNQHIANRIKVEDTENE